MDGFHHLVVVQSLGGRQLDLPTSLKSLAHFGIIHRLVTRQHVRHGAMVAGSLHVIVPAQRISAGSRAHVIPGDKQQVRNGRRRIRTLAVLRDSHGPQDANTLRVRNHSCHGGQSFHWQTTNPRGRFHGEGLQVLSVLLQPAHPLIQELSVGLPAVQQIATDRA